MRLVNFLRLARNRKIGLDKGDFSNYFKFQEFQAYEILKELHRRKIDLSKMRVLELAVGVGGYSPVFQRHSGDLVINDVRDPPIMECFPSLKLVKFDAAGVYPFDDDSFDFVFCCSLIEHIANPQKMLSEISRVLRPGGFLYLSFPPFYTLIGGHEFKPFHLLGERLSLKIVNFLKKKHIKSYASLYDRDYAVYGLHKRSIRGVKSLLRSSGFGIVDFWTRFSFFNTAKIPLFNEFFSWHVCFLCVDKKQKHF